MRADVGDGAPPLPAIRVCSAVAGLLSEGPRWDADRAELIWVDILAGELHIAPLDDDGNLEPVRTLRAGRHVGAAAPALGGGYVLAAAGGFCHIDDNGTIVELAQPEGDRTDVRMNDGICDTQGRFWGGTMAYAETPGAGRLYRLEVDGRCTLVLDGLTIANGMGWSPDATTMYLADSGTGDIYAFDFDPASGDIDGRRCRCRKLRPGHAASVYSWITPPILSCRRTRNVSRSVTAAGRGRSGAAWPRERCGRWVLW
jgi:sugar lactone lactonase YvrE